jgi:hypothetical protein
LFSCWKCATNFGTPAACSAAVPEPKRKPDKQQDQWQRLGGRCWARWTVSGIEVTASLPITLDNGSEYRTGDCVAIERADLDALRVFLDRVAEVLG